MPANGRLRIGWLLVACLCFAGVLLSLPVIAIDFVALYMIFRGGFEPALLDFRGPEYLVTVALATVLIDAALVTVRKFAVRKAAG